ncbi:sensor histidine kinase [Paucihalobacter sp.]|uniref:sensor histidine kinase n=1 Tax=Paucihalobacter sp. TaxID=2850405 RepID=UPI002FE3483C
MLLFIFTKNEQALRVDYLYTLAYTAALVIPVSLNLYILIPYFLKKERYLSFFFLFVALIAISAISFNLFFIVIIDALFKNYFFISYHSNSSFTTILSIAIIAVTLIKLAEDWFYFNQTQNKIIRDAHQITQSQLSALRSQINPHFLFNALNVIYAMSLEQKSTTKDAVLQLSDILRYVIYDANTKKVMISQELELIKSYIAFNKNRSATKLETQLISTVENPSFEIYPMLLLPLIENAYKHGGMNKVEQNFINIALFQKDTMFNFEIENSVHSNFQKELENNGGVGLKNVQENLKIVYPQNHSLNIQETPFLYKVSLQINL